MNQLVPYVTHLSRNPFRDMEHPELCRDLRSTPSSVCSGGARCGHERPEDRAPGHEEHQGAAEQGARLEQGATLGIHIPKLRSHDWALQAHINSLQSLSPCENVLGSLGLHGFTGQCMSICHIHGLGWRPSNRGLFSGDRSRTTIPVGYPTVL